MLDLVIQSHRAELNTQYTVAATSLVYEFVSEHRSWPSSWNELEVYRKAAASNGRPWMDSRELLEQHVTIDFTGANQFGLRQVSHASIRPKGLAYPGPIDARLSALLGLVEQCTGRSGAHSMEKEERHDAGKH